MPFKYRAITANCGNDAIGKKASETIASLLDDDRDADFYVLNCQEVDFEKTKLQLEKEVAARGYKVVCIGKMATHTKPDTQFHDNTGIATFVICKDDLTVSDAQTIAARRSSRRLSSAYNKGGVITDFTVSKIDGERLNLQAVSGHLDARSTTKRNQDWHNLHNKSAKKEVGSWDELVAICPNLRLSGYDANTRNKLDEQGKDYNMWERTENTPEIQGLHQAPFGDRRFSGDATYDKTKGDSIADPKREGYAARGMLDFIDIADCSDSQDGIISDSTVILVEQEESTSRDHKVVISPIQEYKPVSDFEAVKGQMASSLRYVAPDLAKQIRGMKDPEKDKAELIELYNQFLSPNGLLNKAIELHTTKLESYNRLMQAPFLKDPSLKQEISDVIFKKQDWCGAIPVVLAAKAELMSALLYSLEHCSHESAIQARLNLYKQLEQKSNNGDFSVADPKLEFQLLAVDQYQKIRNQFELDLQFYVIGDPPNPNRQKFKEMGAMVLKQIDSIAKPNDPNAISKLDANSLDRLTRIAELCHKACEASKDETHQEGIVPITDELISIAKEVSGKSSVLWRALGTTLDFFARVTSAVVGLVSENSKELGPNWQIVNEKRLTRALDHYKEALKSMTENDKASGETISSDKKDDDLEVFTI